MTMPDIYTDLDIPTFVWWPTTIPKYPSAKMLKYHTKGGHFVSVVLQSALVHGIRSRGVRLTKGYKLPDGDIRRTKGFTLPDVPDVLFKVGMAIINRAVYISKDSDELKAFIQELAETEDFISDKADEVSDTS